MATKILGLGKKLFYSLLIFSFFIYASDRISRWVIVRFDLKTAVETMISSSIVFNALYVEFIEPDSKLIWRLKKNFIHHKKPILINSRGMRNGEFNEKKSETHQRILMMGDSCVFGWGVDQNQTVSFHLEQILGQHRKVEVLNAGVPGYSSYQGLLYTNEVIKYSPDIVTIQLGFNDQWMTPVFNDRQILEYGLAHLGRLPTLNLPVIRKLWITRLTSYLLDKLFYGKFDVNNLSINYSKDRTRVSPAEFYSNIEKIIKKLKEEKIMPILVTSPHSKNQDEKLKNHDKYMNILRDISRKNTVLLVDLHEKLQKKYKNNEEFFQWDGIHFNSKGTFEAAKIMAGIIDEYTNHRN